ncbi:MAG: hypothetical protein LBJ63_02180 [Prevotellaceae bacterium]|nr:hypothetical protein [Prevotellaceae bacterium]
MMKFFEYCFYRIANSKLYKKLDKKEPYIWACGWITLSQSCNIMTIITLYYIINNTKYDFKSVWITTFIVVCCINILLLTRKKYEKLQIYYKDEKHKTIKGWGVFLYVILSLLLFGYVMIKLFWVPKINDLPI